MLLAVFVVPLANAEDTATDPRGEVRTFVSFPEWYIVYSAEEYADFVARGGYPSGFPYASAIRQYWDSVRYAKISAEDSEPIDRATESVLRFVGASFSGEMAIIGLYENSIGRLTEYINFGFKTPEDRYTERVAHEYGEFLLHTPWYRFPYFEKLRGLWSTYGPASITVRGIERRVIFTFAYAAKGAYGKIIGAVTSASYAPAGLTTNFTVMGITEDRVETLPEVAVLEVYDNGRVRAEAPRYRAFTPVAQSIVAEGGTFIDIQENDRIILTAIVADETCLVSKGMEAVFSMPILTNPPLIRSAYVVPVPQLHQLIDSFDACGVQLEHVYDY